MVNFLYDDPPQARAFFQVVDFMREPQSLAPTRRSDPSELLASEKSEFCVGVTEMILGSR